MARIGNRLTGEVFEIDPKAARISRMRRRIWVWCKTCEEIAPSKKSGVTNRMITLTYKKSSDWKPLHIREFMLKARAFLGDRIMGYAWVAEMQRRGAVHYHVVIVFKTGKGLPYPDKSGWWPHGSSRVEKVKNFLYLMKYTQKGISDENNYPVGARIFAVWLPRSLQKHGERFRNWLVSPYPSWVRGELLSRNAGVRAKPAAGGGWIIGGEVVKSPYIFLGR